MRIQVEIEDSKLQNLSDSAKQEISKEGKIYLEDVLDEASRIEESRRNNNSNVEITATIISDAVSFTKHYGFRKRSPKKSVWIQIVSSVAAVMTGGLFQIDKFQNVVFLVVFLVVLAVAISTSVYLIFFDAKND